MRAELWLTAAFCEQNPTEAPLVFEFVKDVFGIRPLTVELHESFFGFALPVVPADRGDGFFDVGGELEFEEEGRPPPGFGFFMAV